MRVIDDFDKLNLPSKQQGFLRVFLSNISGMENVLKIILFGSCAKGNYHMNSDIDLFVITERESTIDEEVFIMSECPPDYENEYYIPSDIIIKTGDDYEKYKNKTGMLQKYVEHEGIDLSGLLQKRSR